MENFDKPLDQKYVVKRSVCRVQLKGDKNINLPFLQIYKLYKKNICIVQVMIATYCPCLNRD